MALPSDLPVIDADRLNLIFANLGTMEVTLDPDPLEFGPKRMNGKVAKTRTMLSHCERIFLQVSHDLQLYKRAHRGAQLQYDLQTQDLLANDPETRAGRNVRDRDAIATMRLREPRELLNLMEVTIQDLEMVLTVVKAKRADLRDIQVRLAQQQKLCEAEIGLGAKWGSKPGPGADAPDLDASPRIDQSVLSQIQDLLDSSESTEVHLAVGDTAWIDPASVAPGDDDTVLDNIMVDEEVDVFLSETDHDPEADPDPDAIDALLAEVDAIRRGDDDVLAGFPQVGWCGVPGCGKPAFMTPSGSVCSDGHGGAEVLTTAPTTDVIDAEELVPETTPDPVVAPDPEPEPVVTPDPEPAKAAEPGTQAADVSFDDLFGDTPDASTQPAMAAVTTDSDVDALFARMVVEPTAKKPKPPAEEQDIDSLIDMFS